MLMKWLGRKGGAMRLKRLFGQMMAAILTAMTVMSTMPAMYAYAKETTSEGVEEQTEEISNDISTDDTDVSTEKSEGDTDVSTEKSEGDTDVLTEKSEGDTDASTEKSEGDTVTLREKGESDTADLIDNSEGNPEDSPVICETGGRDAPVLYRSSSYNSNINACIAEQYRSVDQIRAFINAHPVTNCKAGYKTQPLLSAPYAPGELDDRTIQDGLNALNQIRYIAGLYSDVTIDTSYNEYAQATSIVNFANGSISHYPGQPNGMSDDLYNLGYQGAGRSNLACGWGSGYSGLSETDSLAYTVYGMYLEDGDAGNIQVVGHRRWALNPSMGKTGFGYVGRESGRSYEYSSAMYAFDNSVDAGNKVAMWPAQNTPLYYFDHSLHSSWQNDSYPWSFSTGNSENINTVRVNLKNLATGAQWNFYNGTGDGYFNVDNGGYGLRGCIIFNPASITYSVGDKFRVTMTGLSTGETVTYDVNFFDIAATGGSGSGGNEENNTVIPDGLRQETDGSWSLYLNGSVATGYNDLYCDPSIGWWKIRNGKIDSGYSDLYWSPSCGWWKITNGAVDFGFNDLYCDPEVGWWKIAGGTVDFGYTDLYCSPTYGWWKIAGGAVDFAYNDLYNSPSCGWWKIDGGRVDFGYNDLYNSPSCGWWKIAGGSVDFGYSDLYCSPSCGWWKINGGSVDFGYNDLYGSPTCGWWLVTGGAVNFGYTDLFNSPTCGWWKVNTGYVDFGYSDLYNSPTCGWWKINGGSVDFGYTDLYCSPTCGWW